MNTVLFDLDGTVLPLDTDEFVSIYFSEMEKAFKGFKDQNQIVKKIWSATNDMIESTDERTNEQVFMDSFKKLVEEDFEKYIEVFDKFYDEGYLKTEKSVKDKKNIFMKRSIQLLKDKGYTLALATNPIFPKKAVYHRIVWGGFNPEDFSHITYYENSHYCKPQIKYFEEIMKIINKKPEECLMVGNDVQEDMIVNKIGVKTFLINEYVINRDEKPVKVNYEGNYEKFFEFVEGLPLVK